MYDYVFYLSRNTKINLVHLKEKLIDSNYIDDDSSLTLDDVKDMLIRRFHEIDFTSAKEDVIPFIKDISALNIWSDNFFIAITDTLKSK